MLTKTISYCCPWKSPLLLEISLASHTIGTINCGVKLQIILSHIRRGIAKIASMSSLENKLLISSVFLHLFSMSIREFTGASRKLGGFG